jgi:hypothetical protein
MTQNFARVEQGMNLPLSQIWKSGGGPGVSADIF